MPAVTLIGHISTGDPCGAPPHMAASGSGNVFVNGRPVVRVGDIYIPHSCPSSPPHNSALAGGSGTVFVNGIPAGRIGDPIDCGAVSAEGSGNVFLG